MATLYYLGRRIGQMIPILIGVSVVSFLLVRLVPGDPVQVLLGNHYTPDAAASLRHSLGLDRSIWIQYWHFVTNCLRGDFGESYVLHTTVSHQFSVRLRPTLFLAAYAGVMTAVITLVIGTWSGLRAGGVVDQVARVVFLVGFATPGFLLGVLLILYLGVKLAIFPISGYGDAGFVDHVEHLTLPAFTLAIPFSTVLIRSLRASIIEVARSDYITTMRLMGISSATVVRRHILPNALLPLVMVFGVNLAFLVGGTVVVENVFSIPGLGSLLVSSVATRDFPVVQALTVLFAVFVLAVNLLADFVYTAFDPRQSFEGA